MCVRTQSCPAVFNPSPPGFSVDVILQARILEWVAISSSRGSSRPRDRTPVSWISCIGRRILYLGITLHIYNRILLFIACHTNRKNLNTNKFSLFRGGRSVRECQIYSGIVEQNVMYLLRDTQCSRNRRDITHFLATYTVQSAIHICGSYIQDSTNQGKSILKKKKKSYRKRQKMIQRRLVWPLSKNDTLIHEALHSFQSPKKKKNLQKDITFGSINTPHTLIFAWQ